MLSRAFKHSIPKSGMTPAAENQPNTPGKNSGIFGGSSRPKHNHEPQTDTAKHQRALIPTRRKWPFFAGGSVHSAVRQISVSSGVFRHFFSKSMQEDAARPLGVPWVNAESTSQVQAYYHYHKQQRYWGGVRQDSVLEGTLVCRPAEGQHVDTFPPFPRGVVYGAYP